MSEVNEAASAPTQAADATAGGSGGSGGGGGGAPAAVEQLVVVDRAHYHLLGELGRGGLGRVLRARDLRTGREVAIKEALRATPSLLARFAREAIITANLQHPAIVPVYEVGRWASGEPFYAMRIVAKRSLSDAIRGARALADRLPLLRAVGDVANAVAYAHGQRVIHRDLKPDNVLLGELGETVVIDWGLAKRLDDPDLASLDSLEPERAAAVADGQTVAGSAIGTPGYMAPEQARGERADERADVWAIGAILYEVLARVRPYAEATRVGEVMELAAIRPPRPLAEIDPAIPPELIAIVERAMAFAHADRYPDATQLAADLARYQAGQLVGAHRYSAWMLARRWLRRHRALAGVSAAALLALAAVGGYSVVRIRAERDRAVAARALAEDRIAALDAEQGRQLALGGDVPRGLPYLAAALAAGSRDPAMRFALARALDDDAAVAVLPGHMAVLGAAFAPDGRLLVNEGTTLRVWDAAGAAPLATLPVHGIAAWRPDGRAIAIADATGGVAVVDPTGRVLARLPGASGGGASGGAAPAAIAMARAGDRVAVAEASGEVAWWDLAHGSLVAAVHAHAGSVRRLAFSPDGATLATAGADDGTAKLWRVADGTPVATLAPQLGTVRDLAFSPDGATLATAQQHGEVVLWDTATGARRGQLIGHVDSVESVAFDRAGARVLTASSDGTAVLWDAHTGKPLATLTAGTIPLLHAAFSPDEHLIVTASERGELRVWSGDGAALARLAGHAGAVGELAFSADGRRLASAGLDGDVRLWRLDGPWPARLLDNGGATSWRGGFSPDGRRIAVTGSDGVARIYDGVTGRLALALRHPAAVTGVAFSPDGARLATACDDGTARVWDLATGDAVRAVDAGAGRVRWVGFSPDGRQLATTHADGTARLWSAASGASLAVLRPPAGKARLIAWSPDGTRLVTPLDGPGGVLWDASGRQLAEARMPAEHVMSAAWRPDGAWFALGATTPEASRFDGATGAPLGDLPGVRMGPVSQLVFAPDRTTLLASAGDGLVHAWNGDAQRAVIGDGIDVLFGVAARPDGVLIATAGTGSDIVVWDAATGARVAALPASPSTGVAWSPDGERLLVLGQAGPPRLWRVAAWRGTQAQLAARLRCTSRWRLDGAHLVPAVPDPAACAR